eukprot:TRINITY_DN27193_c0_g1_i1.p1 TRINITY_DN27193_c0_g1~~TRINITY_DN27193_c0_g1_i1.p1  ORF type:complete len:133 (+),score=36.22 TRINITY_DN27193_c0_g1_i1:122-520(+)
MFKASVFLEELKKYPPEIYECCSKATNGTTEDMDFIRVDKSEFLKCPDDSVDYAVMERTDKTVVVPMDAGWSDVGSWSALWEVSEKDSSGNVIHGDAITEDTEGCYIYAPNKLVASVPMYSALILAARLTTA